jgi:hypothetical protein
MTRETPNWNRAVAASELAQYADSVDHDGSLAEDIDLDECGPASGGRAETRRADITEIFLEAQEMVFGRHPVDLYGNGLTKEHAFYGDAGLTQVNDVLKGNVAERTRGMDSGGSMAYENTHS